VVDKKEKEAPSFIDLPAYAVNPFLDKVTLGSAKTKKKVKGNIKLPNVDGVEVEVNVDGRDFMVNDNKMVDQEEFIKIFKDTLRYLMKLSPTAVKVMAFVLDRSMPNQDAITYSVEQCMQYTGFKGRQSVYDGLSELAQKGFIARAKTRGKLYINPSYIFNGNRIVLVKRFQKRIDKIRKHSGL